MGEQVENAGGEKLSDEDSLEEKNSNFPGAFGKNNEQEEGLTGKNVNKSSYFWWWLLLILILVFCLLW